MNPKKSQSGEPIPKHSKPTLYAEMCRSPTCAGHAGWRRWWRVKRSYLPRPSLPGTAPGAQIPSRTSVLGRGQQEGTASGGPARSKCEDISVKPDRLQIAKGNFCPLAMKRLSISLNRKQRTRFKCKTKTLSTCFTNCRAIYSWTSFQVFKMNMGSDAEKRHQLQWIHLLVLI